MTDEYGCKNFALGFFAGAAVGAIGALLMAPMSGSRLRRELSQQGQRLSKRVSETAEEMRDKGAEVYGSAAEVVSDAARSLHSAGQSLSR